MSFVSAFQATLEPKDQIEWISEEAEPFEFWDDEWSLSLRVPVGSRASLSPPLVDARGPRVRTAVRTGEAA